MELPRLESSGAVQMLLGRRSMSSHARSLHSPMGAGGTPALPGAMISLKHYHDTPGAQGIDTDRDSFFGALLPDPLLQGIGLAVVLIELPASLGCLGFADLSAQAPDRS